MNEPKPINLRDRYDHFDLIDEDAQGGLARVAEVTSLGEESKPKRAFKVMRKVDIEDPSKSKLIRPIAWSRFQDEMRLLKKISEDVQTPPMFTRIYDSGFVREDLLKALETYDQPRYELPAYSTGLNTEYFTELGEQLENKEPERWLPFLVVELVPYNHSLFRQIRRRRDWSTGENWRFAPRLPVGEVIYLALQVLSNLEWFHNSTGRHYWDWKTEHLYWGVWGMNGKDSWPPKAHLIDYNWTREIEKDPGPEENLRVELRGFCGALLYPALTLVDLEGETLSGNPTRPRVGRVSEHAGERYLRENLSFHHAEEYLDEPLKAIVRRALNPKEGYQSTEELKVALQQYAKKHLGLDFQVSGPGDVQVRYPVKSGEQYWEALHSLRLGQNQLGRARSDLSEALLNSEEDSNEFENLIRAIDHALQHYLLP